MRRRLLRWLLVLYPRAWRDRYGAEVASLNEELIRAGETTPLRAGLGLIAGAAVERGRAPARTRYAVAASAIVLVLVGAGVASAVTRPPARTAAIQRRTPTVASARVASLNCIAPSRVIARPGGPGPIVARVGRRVTILPGPVPPVPPVPPGVVGVPVKPGARPRVQVRLPAGPGQFRPACTPRRIRIRVLQPRRQAVLPASLGRLRPSVEVTRR
jgi:hypothetical protein